MTVGIELQRKPTAGSNLKLARLGDHVEILSGFAFDSSRFATDGEMPLVRIRDVVRGRTETYYSGSFDERFVVRKGDLLVGMDGDFNRETWSSEPALLNQRVCRISPLDANLDRRYLYHFLPQALMEIWHATPFATVKHLSVKTIREIVLPLPPLDEQRRIAAILDKADELRTKRRQALAHLDALTQSIFHSMLLQNTDSELHLLEDVVTAVIDCPHTTPRWTESGVTCLRTSNLGLGCWDWTDHRFVSEEQHLERSKRAHLEAGDIVLSREGTVGVAAIVPEDMKASLGQRLVQVRPNQEILNSQTLLQYLLFTLSPVRISNLMVGATSKHLNVKDLRKLVVPVPPISVQQTFSAKIEAIERLRGVQKRQLAELDELFASFQHNAFSRLRDIS